MGQPAQSGRGIDMKRLCEINGVPAGLSSRKDISYTERLMNFRNEGCAKTGVVTQVRETYQIQFQIPCSVTAVLEEV